MSGGRGRGTFTEARFPSSRLRVRESRPYGEKLSAVELVPGKARAARTLHFRRRLNLGRGRARNNYYALEFRPSSVKKIVSVFS